MVNRDNISTNKWYLASGSAALLGGMCWIIKGGLIFPTGEQPLVLFEIAPALFGIAIVGLAGHINGRSRLAQVGVVFAIVGGVAALFNSVRELTMAVTEIAVIEIELLSALAGFGWLLGLFLVGIPVWRRQALPGKWRFLPLLMAVSSFPLVVLFSMIGESIGMFSELGERMIEFPLMLIGLAWVVLGWCLVINSEDAI